MDKIERNHRLAGSVYQRQGYPSEALAQAEAAIALEPEADGAAAQAHYQRGSALLELDRVSDAIEAFERAGELGHESASYAGLMALAQRGDEAGALRIFRTHTWGLWMTQAVARVAVRRRQLTLARIAYESALALSPADWQSRIGLASVLTYESPAVADPARALEVLDALGNEFMVGTGVVQRHPHVPEQGR